MYDENSKQIVVKEQNWYVYKLANNIFRQKMLCKSYAKSYELNEWIVSQNILQLISSEIFYQMIGSEWMKYI